ncbi:MAG: VCBS repeat-containing protein, partial [Candidatus Omnitrophica bacterium]|nr:VCBS repeat-containing protein [Candidatus Omnitrophota bacterium]
KVLDMVRNADLSDPDKYREFTRLLDVVNFADYILLNVFAGTEDWPNNNWTVARLREPGSKFRFYVWDAEISFAQNNPSYHNSFDLQLEELDVPIAEIYRGVKLNPDFQSLMAARFRKHFYESGALRDDAVMKLFLDLRDIVRNALPNMLTRLPALWIPGRRENVEKHLMDKGFLNYTDLPKAGGATPQGLPETEIDLPESGPNLIPDNLIDPKDLLEFLDQKAKSQWSFGFARKSWANDRWERCDYSVNLGDLSLVSADFNQDGSIDLGCVNNGYGTISIFLNSGNGVFNPPVQSEGLLGAEILAATDMDQDHYPDLVLANRIMYKQFLTTFHNNGDGTFTQTSSIPINRTEETQINFPASIQLKDMDGDGDADAVIQHQSSIKDPEGRPHTNLVSVYENQGGGHLALAQNIFGGTAEQVSHQCLVVEDLDGDLDRDIVVSDGDVTLMVIENLGGLNFMEPRRVPAPGLQRYFSIAPLDLEGDGDIDVIGSSKANSTINIFINDGDGNLAADPAFRVNANLPETLLVDDFNSDSFPDFLTIDFSPLFLRPKGGFNLFTNDGAGKFSTTEPFYTASHDPLPRFLVSGDFDGDSDIDFAALDRYNGLLSVYLNRLVPQPPSADFNSDQKIDFLDLLEISKEWGSEVSGP